MEDMEWKNYLTVFHRNKTKYLQEISVCTPQCLHPSKQTSFLSNLWLWSHKFITSKSKHNDFSSVLLKSKSILHKVSNKHKSEFHSSETVYNIAQHQSKVKTADFNLAHMPSDTIVEQVEVRRMENIADFTKLKKKRRNELSTNIKQQAKQALHYFCAS